eukprot:TRINITY_DN70228_c0_g1_i1.p1 TRINITY_DN70228_c0_g1~~TRINITY_DN70228_c0_g1_i1.p1  ORF type:complete len:294 (+),score=54.69 TRINITY_DN70228_c0_g1_i1:82-882(+)
MARRFGASLTLAAEGHSYCGDVAHANIAGTDACASAYAGGGGFSVLASCCTPASTGKRAVAAAFLEYSPPCQRWAVTDRLDDVVNGIDQMRTIATPWLMGSRLSPPLAAVSPAVWSHVRGAHRDLAEASAALHARQADAKRLEFIPDENHSELRNEKARFFAHVPGDVLARTHSGVHRLEAAAVAQRKEEFEIGPKVKDAALRQRQFIAVRELLAMAVEALRVAERCSAVVPGFAGLQDEQYGNEARSAGLTDSTSSTTHEVVAKA